MENLPAGVFVKIIEQRLDRVVVQLHGIRLHLLLDHLLHPLVRQDWRSFGDVLRGEHCFGVVRERCLYRRSFFPEYFVHGDTKDLGNLRQFGNIGHRPTVFPAADRLIADPQRVRQRHLRHALRPPALGDSLSDLSHFKHNLILLVCHRGVLPYRIVAEICFSSGATSISHAARKNNKALLVSEKIGCRTAESADSSIACVPVYAKNGDRIRSDLRVYLFTIRECSRSGSRVPRIPPLFPLQCARSRCVSHTADRVRKSTVRHD